MADSVVWKATGSQQAFLVGQNFVLKTTNFTNVFVYRSNVALKLESPESECKPSQAQSMSLFGDIQEVGLTGLASAHFMPVIMLS